LLYNAVPILTKHIKDDFGAVGDGVHDDTLAVTNALNSGQEVDFTGAMCLITADITPQKNFYLKGLNGGSIKSDGSKKIIVPHTLTEIILQDLLFDGVALYGTDRSNGIDLNLYLKRFKIKQTNTYGINLSNLDWLVVEDSKFNNIGETVAYNNTTYLGMGIRSNYVKRLLISGSYFERTRGSGAIVPRHASQVNIYHNEFYAVDFRAIIFSNDDDETETKGSIENNEISYNGIYSAHTDESVWAARGYEPGQELYGGEGCNGIYAGHGNYSKLAVRKNHIFKVCENGIEGPFGIIEDNVVEDTGYGMVLDIDKSTPAGSGMSVQNGCTIRNNKVKRSYASAYSYYNATKIENLILEGNIAEDSNISEVNSNSAINLNSGTYENIKISGNIVDKPLYMNLNNYTDIIFEDNRCTKDDFYKFIHNVKASVYGKGNILKSGFEFSDATHFQANPTGFAPVITTSNCTIARQSDTVGSNTIYYPQFTNDGTTYGKFTMDIPVPGACLIELSATFKDADLYFSVAPKDFDGNMPEAGSRKTYNMVKDDVGFVTRKIIYNLNGYATKLNVIASCRLAGVATNVTGIVKDITYKCVLK
jgi:hypothetical protein